MISLLFDAGPAMYGGMGDAPLTHSEINAYKTNTKTELTAWEARTLRRLSSVYLSESSKAQEPDCPEPFQPEPDPISKAEVSAKLQAALRLLMATKPKK